LANCYFGPSCAGGDAQGALMVLSLFRQQHFISFFSKVKSCVCLSRHSDRLNFISLRAPPFLGHGTKMEDVYNFFLCVWWRELLVDPSLYFYPYTQTYIDEEREREREREIRRLGPSCSCPATDLNRRPAERDDGGASSSKDGRVCTEILDTIKNRISFLPCSSSSPFFSLLLSSP
jgi:hypothetical protein